MCFSGTWELQLSYRLWGDHENHKGQCAALRWELCIRELARERDTAFESVARLNLRHAMNGPLGMDEESRTRERNATSGESRANRVARLFLAEVALLKRASSCRKFTHQSPSCVTLYVT